LLVALRPLDLPRRETIALDWKIALIVIVVGALLGWVLPSVSDGVRSGPPPQMAAVAVRAVAGTAALTARASVRTALPK